MVSYQEEDVENEISIERNHACLVYNSSKDAYEAFISSLPDIMKEFEVKQDSIEDGTLDRMLSYCREKYFAGDHLPPVKNIDIESILKFYAYCGREPEFLPIDKLSRDKANLSYIAQDSLDRELSRREEKEYLDSLWNDDSTLLKLFYSEYEYFKRQYDKEIDKILDGKVSSEGPKRTWEQRELERMTLQQWIEREPVSGLKLRDDVFASAEEKGVYRCAICGMSSPHRKDFQIDHIKPMSKGGLTVRENLQLLCRKCNWIKSDHEDDLPLASREVSDDVLPGVARDGEKIIVTLGAEIKRFNITSDRKRRGSMTFAICGKTYSYEFAKGKVAVMR